jgi:tetratricopeptide (TPR) repeat protein
MTIVFSIAGILFVVGKNFSKVKEASREQIFSEESVKEKEEKEKFMYLYERATRRINKENYHKKMAEFWLWLEKFLRKIRLMVMKLDGRIVALLERLRQKNVKTVEEWKKMAGAAEKNIQKRQGFFAAGKEALKKRKKPDENTGEAAVGMEDTVMPMAGGEAVLYEEQVISEDEPYEIDREDVSRKESEAYAAEYAEEEKTFASEQEPEAEYAENEAVTARRSELASMIEKIDEFAQEIEGTELFKKSEEEARKESIAEETGVQEGEVAAEKTEETEETGEEIVSENPEEENVRTKKEQECIEMLMKDPADIKAYWKLGIIYSKRRNYEDALACFRQIVKIDPTYTKAKQKVIEVMEKMKKRGK